MRQKVWTTSKALPIESEVKSVMSEQIINLLTNWYPPLIQQMTIISTVNGNVIRKNYGVVLVVTSEGLILERCNALNESIGCHCHHAFCTFHHLDGCHHSVYLLRMVGGILSIGTTAACVPLTICGHSIFGTPSKTSNKGRKDMCCVLLLLF